MNLREAGVREGGSFFVSAPDRGAVRSLGIRRQVIDVSISASTQRHGVGRMGLNFSRDQIARHDATSLTIDHHQVEHLGTRVHGDPARADLPFQGLVRAQQELLTGLSSRVKSARHLRAAERSIRQSASILAGKRNALGYALVDNLDADLRQPVHIRFARSEVAAFHRVVEKPEYAVAVILIILGRIDSALGRDTVRAPGRILKTETLDVVAELS